MKKLLKNKKIRIVLLVIFALGVIAGAVYYYCHPQYKIIQRTRALAWGENTPSTYVMSPAKIEITRLNYGYPLTIPVKIINTAGDMNYNVKFQDPVIIDKGFVNADGNNDYSYSWDKSTMEVLNNTTGVVYITIKKNSLKASGGLEKGIAIYQSPVGGQVNISFSYVFEILIK